MKKKVVLFVIFFFVFSCKILLAQTQPKDVINLYVDRVISIINRAQTLEKDKKAEYLKKELRHIGEEIFLFDVMARMTVGYKWRRFTEDQKKEFKELFIRFIEMNYFDKLLNYLDKIKNLSRNDIKVLSQKMLTKIKAEVSTTIRYEDKEIPVKYRLVKIKDNWKVYDVYVEGVGLVQNYRQQFRSILKNRSPEDFLKELKKKIEEKKNEKKD